MRGDPQISQMSADLAKCGASLVRIAVALEQLVATLGAVVDVQKRTLRTVDVERGNVYKARLGKNLRKSSKSADKKSGGAR